MSVSAAVEREGARAKKAMYRTAGRNKQKQANSKFVYFQRLIDGYLLSCWKTE